ncbi:hypothetical protein diail_3452 [Diaporthe ilicicola]|nr:hypothetical protein diail_3452 [Diaporthe ilicicola]
MDTLRDVHDGNYSSAAKQSAFVKISVCEVQLEPTSPAAESNDDPGPPDGGVCAWLQVLNCFITNCLSWGYPAAFGVFQLYYTETLDLNSSQIAWVGSVQTFSCFVMSAPSGRLADAGYSRETTAFGAGLLVFGTFMTSLCTEYWQILLAQGVCTGIGLGLISMPSIVAMTGYFSRRQSIAMALGGMGAGFGSAVFPAMVQYLIPAIGFAWAVRCLAFLFLVVSIASVFLIKSRLAPRKDGPLFEWTAFKEPSYLLYTLGTFLIFWALYFTTFFVQIYATQFLSFNDNTSVSLPIILAAVAIPARPLAGLAASYLVGPMNLFILSTVALGSITASWIAVSSSLGMYIFVVFWGFANGFLQAAFGASLAALTDDPNKMGTRYGMVVTLLAFSTLAGPPTAGILIDNSGGRFFGAQIWATVVTIFGGLAVASGRWWITGWKAFVRI